MTILWNGWILPIGGASAVEGSNFAKVLIKKMANYPPLVDKRLSPPPHIHLSKIKNIHINKLVVHL